jgi:peptidoglycan hydrolase CwlO-like protein
MKLATALSERADLQRRISELQKQVDAYSRQLRETDELIQSLNWTTELI